jgi:hypothetical protein
VKNREEMNRILIKLVTAILVLGGLLVTMDRNEVVAATSGDAYANYDSVTGTWTMGTGTIEKKVQLSGGNFRMTRLYNKLTSREMLQSGQTGTEFRITVSGASYHGNGGGWTLVSESSAVGEQGSVTQDITIRNSVLDVTLHYIIWPSTGVIEQYTEFKNRTGSGYTISDPELLSTNVMSADIASGDTKFYYFTGGNNKATSLRLQTDTPSSGWIRELQSVHYGAEDYLQEVVYRRTAHDDGVLLGWSYGSNWFSRFSGNGTVQVDAYGANGTTLAAGATLRLPLTHIMVYKGDLDDAGNALKDFQYRYKWDLTKDKWVGAVKPFIWSAGTKFDHANMFRFTEYFRYVGADMWHIDDHWYDRAGDWNNITTTNFGQLNKLAKKNEMDLMVWMPIWNANASSAVLTANPTWDTAGTVSDCSIANNMQNELIMSNSAVNSWMLNKLNSKRAEWGDWIWRQDFGGGSFDGAGVNQINASLNYFKLMKDFKTANPNSGINVNNCGGRQMSVEAFRYADIVQTTDSANGHYSIYTPSYLYAPDKYWGDLDAGSNLSWSASQVTLRALLGSAWQWNADGTPTPAQLEAFRKNADIYHFMKSIGLAGRWSKMYHPDKVTNDDKTYYVQRMNNDNTKGVIIPLHSHFNANFVTVYPKGLQPALNYTVRFHNSGFQVSNTGAYWMANGIGAQDWGGDLVWLNVTNYPGAGTDSTNPTAPSAAAKTLETQMNRGGVSLTWTAGADNNWVSHYEIYKNGVYSTKVAKGNYVFLAGASLSDSYTIRTVDGDDNKSAFATAATSGDNAANSFGNVQGAGNWSYKQTSDLVTYTNLTWNAANGYWKGTGYSILSRYWNHPDTTVKSARTWTAPTTGTVTVFGHIAKGYEGQGGNGVQAKIMKNGTQIWPASGWQTIGATNTVGIDYELSVSVTAGDNLYFVLDSIGNTQFDNTEWSATVKY